MGSFYFYTYKKRKDKSVTKINNIITDILCLSFDIKKSHKKNKLHDFILSSLFSHSILSIGSKEESREGQ